MQPPKNDIQIYLFRSHMEKDKFEKVTNIQQFFDLKLILWKGGNFNIFLHFLPTTLEYLPLFIDIKIKAYMCDCLSVFCE